MLNTIDAYIQKNQLIREGETVVLGLSGGPDSVFLLHLLAPLHHEKKISLIAAHLDHEWRENSSDDVAFCKKVTEQLGVPFVSAKASALPTQVKKNGSQEELGRKLRRFFLEKVADEHNASIALAHHAQDQEETFFIRLIRGTTITGLVGMRPKHGRYIRPLLETNKADILQYLEEHHISYCVDPTNTSPNYLRNKIRLDVLPALAKVDPRYAANFSRTLRALAEAETVLEQVTQKIFEEATQNSDGTTRLNLETFFSHPAYLQKKILLQWLITHRVPFTPTESLLDEMIRFLVEGTQKKHKLLPAWGIIKEKKFARLQEESPD